MSSELKKQIQSARLAKKLTQVRGGGAGGEGGQRRTLPAGGWASVD